MCHATFTQPGRASADLVSRDQNMSPKPMEPFARKIFKGIILFEVAGVIGAYALFHKMNSSRDFRCTVNTYCPQILEVYYRSNEWSGIYGIREADQEKD
ncbi:protein CEBPZOS-like isoform X2 [Xyrauchen texanus]|uniref:protein CEBPZOS-like isoform X2 n=1 Tax=Xyrauchen texanus TaxID=154827 RepID=UPI0022425F46|nr:protein CEBPZOS-like isoform X2 [Xyrauchen texanus]